MSDQPPSVRCPKCQCEVPFSAAPAPMRCWRRWRTVLVVAGLFLFAVAIAAWRYRGQVQTVLQWVTEATGSTTLSVVALGAAAVVALCLLAWLLLPVVFVVAWLDLRRRLGKCDGPRSE